MRRDVSFVLALLLVVSCTGQRPPRTVDSVERTGARPGDRVRVVRFNVKPGMRAQFEDFFWRSLKPAAETLRPEQSDPVGTFRLLIPESENRDGFYTYYVLVDPIAGEQRSGQAMRDLVRAAFPGEEGERRVRSWMESIVLGELAPVGEQFVEADLRADDPPPAE
jgi:hypothetical protein